MGKSKSGGTRTYIRGRVGSDVYSIGRDAKGKKQQIVRSLAESVANPQTQAQMKGRMIMSTIAQALAVLRPIVDHSFDGAFGVRGNLSEFTSRNYALIKADIAAHPASGNTFGLNMYQERGAKKGKYVVSDGAVPVPAAVAVASDANSVTVSVPADAKTVGDLRTRLGFGAEDYITILGIAADGSAFYSRLNINSELADSVEISASNESSIFVQDGNALATVEYISNNLVITFAQSDGNIGVIITKKTTKGFQHSACTLALDGTADYTADVALPTYPVGSERYLNGGDIFGGAVSVAAAAAAPTQNSDSGSGSQAASAHTLTLSKSGSGTVAMSVGGNAVATGASVNDGATVSIEVTPESEKTATASINGNSVALSLSNGKYVGTFTMPAQNSTLTVNTAVEAGGGDNHNPIDTGN